jgi:predicted nuclease of restriction endonuclease-like RecB superfamily
MRLALGDVKKSVVRRQGEAYLVPHLLRPTDLAQELAALIALHEEWRGRQRADFPADRPAELVGDYRLARCLVTVLGEYYAWSAPAWPGPASDAAAQTLAARAIASPSQLRLALYDAVNAAGGGYLLAGEREAFLDAFARDLALTRDALDVLLALDAEERSCLTRLVDRPPTPAELSALYNRRAVEALLANASEVEWLLPPAFATARGIGLGTMLKHICSLARHMSVYYDVVFAEPPAGSVEPELRVAERRTRYAGTDDALAPLDAAQASLAITLYGAQEAFGGPTQYGDRLAALCRLILGHNRSSLASAGAAESVRASRRSGGVPGLRGEARVYLRGRPFRFALDEHLLALLDPHAGAVSEAADPSAAEARDLDFDSGLERSLHDEFAALERADATHGWRLEREPEPILCDDIILIPDFALTRGNRRVYLEVAGFWSPGYRERKRHKLAALAGRVDLIVAAPEDARAALASLESAFPWLWFRRRLSAQALVNLLQARFDDFAARRAAVPAGAVLDEVERRGWLPAQECAALLHTYGRSEMAQVADDLAQAARREGREPLILVEGVGLASPGWLARIGSEIAVWLGEAGGSIILDDVAARLGALVPGLAVHDDVSALAESLVRAAGFEVVRTSLFEPYVVSRDAVEQGSGPLAVSRSTARSTQPRTARRRTQGKGRSATPGSLAPGR